jgi:hypothetical protein
MAAAMTGTNLLAIVILMPASANSGGEVWLFFAFLHTF